jgi:hypothetical protein
LAESVWRQNGRYLQLKNKGRTGSNLRNFGAAFFKFKTSIFEPKRKLGREHLWEGIVDREAAFFFNSFWLLPCISNEEEVGCKRGSMAEE